MAKSKRVKRIVPQRPEFRAPKFGPPAKPIDPEFERAMAEQFDQYAEAAAAEFSAAPPQPEMVSRPKRRRSK